MAAAVAVVATVTVTGRAARMRSKQRHISTAVSAVLTDGRAAWARRRVRKISIAAKSINPFPSMCKPSAKPSATTSHPSANPWETAHKSSHKIMCKSEHTQPDAAAVSVRGPRDVLRRAGRWRTPVLHGAGSGERPFSMAWVGNARSPRSRGWENARSPEGRFQRTPVLHGRGGRTPVIQRAGFRERPFSTAGVENVGLGVERPFPRAPKAGFQGRKQLG